jgi:hypothetical protein
LSLAMFSATKSGEWDSGSLAVIFCMVDDEFRN